MTVRKADRGESKLEVLNLSRNLAVHTIRLCKNEEAFPKRQRWVFTKRIVDDALDVYECVRMANSTLLSGGPTLEADYQFRRARQVEAHAKLNSLMSLIDLAFEAGNVGERRATHWMSLAKETNDRLKAWMRSDKKRYVTLRGQTD